MTTEEKHELAKRLTSSIGNGFVVQFHANAFYPNEGDSKSNPSTGHLWSAGFWDETRLDNDVNEIWLDDRNGSIVSLLHAGLREKASMYVAMTQILELRLAVASARNAGKAGAA